MKDVNPKIEEVFPIIYSTLSDFTISEVKCLFTTLITVLEERVTLREMLSEEEIYTKS